MSSKATEIYLYTSQQKGGPGVSPGNFYEKQYAIWCILVMPDIYSVSFEDQRFNTYQPPLSCSYKCPICHNIISSEYWMKPIFWTNSEISTFISVVTILMQLPSMSFSNLLWELDLVYV